VVKPCIINGDGIVSCFKGIRDFVVFTDKRLIAVSVQEITDKEPQGLARLVFTNRGGGGQGRLLPPSPRRFRDLHSRLAAAAKLRARRTWTAP
jgi:hypothetical protein